MGKFDMRYVILRKHTEQAFDEDLVFILEITGVQLVEKRGLLLLVEFAGTAGELRARLGELSGQWLVSELRTYRLS